MSLFIAIALLGLLSGEGVPAENARTAQAAPAPTTRIATEADRLPPPEDVVEYSNRTDPEGPGQGELHLQRQHPALTAVSTNAALQRADLMPLPQLRLGSRTAEWGDVLRLRATRDASGQCRVPLRFSVINGGLLPSAATRHVLRQGASLESLGAPVHTLQQAALAAGASTPFEAMLTLGEGSAWIELTLDVDDAVNESNEANNRRRVQLQVRGDCR